MNLLAEFIEIWPFLVSLAGVAIPLIITLSSGKRKLDLVARGLLHHTHDPETGEVDIPPKVMYGFDPKS